MYIALNNMLHDATHFSALTIACATPSESRKNHDP